MSAGTDSLPRVQALVIELLALESVDIDTHLIESGFLDSFALVELLAGVEEEFELSLEFEELDLDVLRSIRSIASYVDALRAGRSE